MDDDDDDDDDVRDGFLRGVRRSAGDEEGGSEADADADAGVGLRFALRSF